MLAQGVDIQVVSRTLGHSTISITADIYADVAPQLSRSAAKGMGELLVDLGLDEVA